MVIVMSAYCDESQKPRNLVFGLLIWKVKKRGNEELYVFLRRQQGDFVVTIGVKPYKMPWNLFLPIGQKPFSQEFIEFLDLLLFLQKR